MSTKAGQAHIAVAFAGKSEPFEGELRSSAGTFPRVKFNILEHIADLGLGNTVELAEERGDEVVINRGHRSSPITVLKRGGTRSPWDGMFFPSLVPSIR
jgi:hypothetical protein